jgi:hypothetical protein
MKLFLLRFSVFSALLFASASADAQHRILLRQEKIMSGSELVVDVLCGVDVLDSRSELEFRGITREVCVKGSHGQLTGVPLGLVPPGIHLVRIISRSSTGAFVLETSKIEVIEGEQDRRYWLTVPIVIGSLVSSIAFIINGLLIGLFERYERRRNLIDACRRYVKAIKEHVKSGGKTQEIHGPFFDIDSVARNGVPRVPLERVDLGAAVETIQQFSKLPTKSKSDFDAFIARIGTTLGA